MRRPKKHSACVFWGFDFIFGGWGLKSGYTMDVKLVNVLIIRKHLFDHVTEFANSVWVFTISLTLFSKYFHIGENTNMAVSNNCHNFGDHLLSA